MAGIWGPYCIVPSILRKTSFGSTILRETFDYDILRQELIADGLPLEVVKVRNLQYYRKKNSDTWLMIGESDDIENHFPVEWDISKLENDYYEVMGLMHVFVEEGVSEKTTIVRQNIAEVSIQNQTI